MIRKFENIQALRGVAVLAVVLFHLAGFEKQYFSAPTVLPGVFKLGCSGVDLFFVISGFVMVMVTKHHHGSLKESSRFIYQRITRIFPLYWVYASILLLSHHFILHESTNITSPYMLKSLFLIPQNDIPFLCVAWTLIHEMYFYIVMMFFVLAPRKKLTTLLGLWGIVLLLANIVFYYYTNSLTPILSLILNPLTFEFIGGCIIGCLISQEIKINSPYIFCFISIALFLIGSFFCFKYINNSAPGIVPFNWQRMLCFGIPAAFLLYAMVLFESKNKLLPKFLRNIGDHSYSIYLSHILVLSAMVKIFYRLHTHNILVHIALLMFGFLVVLIVGKFSYQFLEKPIIAFMRTWIPRSLPRDDNKLHYGQIDQ